jgi:hypothetical protein
MISATIRMSPTARSPITVTRTTSAIIRRSIRATGQPSARANSRSKQARRNSLNRAATASVATSATQAMVIASPLLIAAVWP